MYMSSCVLLLIMHCTQVITVYDDEDKRDSEDRASTECKVRCKIHVTCSLFFMYAFMP